MHAAPRGPRGPRISYQSGRMGHGNAPDGTLWEMTQGVQRPPVSSATRRRETKARGGRGGGGVAGGCSGGQGRHTRAERVQTRCATRSSLVVGSQPVLEMQKPRSAEVSRR